MNQDLKRNHSFARLGRLMSMPISVIAPVLPQARWPLVWFLPRYWHITTRLALLILFPFLLVCAIVGASFWNTMRERRAAEINNARFAAASVSSTVGGFMRDLESTTEAMSLALAKQPAPFSQETIGPYLATMYNQYSLLRTLFVTDLDGKVIAAYQDGSQGTDLSQRPYVRALQNGQETIWSPTLSGTQTGQATIAYGRVIYGVDNRIPRAYLIAAFYPDSLAERFPNYLQPDADITLIDNQGTILYSSQQPIISNEKRGLSGIPEIQAALAGLPTAVESRDFFGTGGAQIGALAPIERNGWVVGYTRSEAVLDDLYSSFLVQVGAILGVMALAALVSLVLARHLATPLMSLAQTAVAIAHGEHPEVSVSVAEGPEVADLSSAIKAMSSAVQEREATLRLSEQIMKQREERLRIAMEAGHIGAWDWNIATGIITSTLPMPNAADGNISQTNETTFDALLQAVHPEDRKWVAQSVKRALKGEAVLLVEYRNLNPDGSLHWIAANGQIVQDSKGAPSRLVGTWLDITERKREELDAQFLAQSTALLNSSLDYQQVLDHLAYLIVSYFADWCVIDIVDKQGTLTRMAIAHKDPAKVEQVRNLQAEMVRQPNVGEGAARVLRTGEAELYATITDEQLQESVAPEYLPAVRALGLKSALMVPLQAQGGTFGVISIVTAESGRHYTAQDLATVKTLARRAGLAIENARLYAELKKATEAKDEFLGLISHELRTPITSIYGAARLMLTRGEQFDNETKVGLITDVAIEAERLSDLIEDLLLIARLELGEIVSPEPVSVQRIIDKVTRAHLRTQQKHPVEVHVQDDLPLIAGEESYVEQVLRNLLSNAEKYSPSTAPIEIQAESDGHEVMVAVLDRGPGLPAEEVERIFERFYRSESTARKTRGVGIGLTVCKRLVELQAGRIWAQPREGGGLEIRFSLPAYETEEL